MRADAGICRAFLRDGASPNDGRVIEKRALPQAHNGRAAAPENEAAATAAVRLSALILLLASLIHMKAQYLGITCEQVHIFCVYAFFRY